jgi:hypothetical protein
MRPDTYQETERCENCYWHDAEYKFGNLLFSCREHNFSHQSEGEMMASVCADYMKEY